MTGLHFRLMLRSARMAKTHGPILNTSTPAPNGYPSLTALSPRQQLATASLSIGCYCRRLQAVGETDGVANRGGSSSQCAGRPLRNECQRAARLGQIACD